MRKVTQVKNTISISFIGGDCFFNEGVRQAIKLYFNSKNVKVVCYKRDNYRLADIVFHSVRWEWEKCFCFFVRPSNLKQINFAVVMPGCKKISRKPGCFYESELIYHNISVNQLVEQIKNTWENRGKNLSSHYCTWCSKHSLSPREKDVMSCMQLEMKPFYIAKNLGLSPKTISAHKISVMKKLGFKSNVELYDWLRDRRAFQFLNKH
ncbi:TPA: hypothetical protein SMF39_004416 [Serratia marcescens]|nr:hypothetical protein [Serratia marcescens]